MQGRDWFSACHPAINFLYFALVLLFSMFFMHPICLGASLICAVAYLLHLNGARAARRSLIFILPLFLLTALLNPIFNHQGATILARLPNGNPLTLESLWFGLAAGTMLAAMIFWFACYNTVMSSDKFVYLFGRLIPALSLVLSMTLRFVPKFKAQLRVIYNAQQGLGRDMEQKSLRLRLRQAATVLSIMTTWCLENAIETADSMRARGYGLPGRSAFSIYCWDKRDSLCLGFLLLSGGYVLAGRLLGALDWRWFPSFGGPPAGAFTLSVYAVYIMLLLTPMAMDVREERRWKRLQSQI